LKLVFGKQERKDLQRREAAAEGQPYRSTDGMSECIRGHVNQWLRWWYPWSTGR